MSYDNSLRRPASLADVRRLLSALTPQEIVTLRKTSGLDLVALASIEDADDAELLKLTGALAAIKKKRKH